MFARYSDDTKEIELAGNQRDFLLLAKKLFEDKTCISLEHEGYNPSPYTGFLMDIKIYIDPTEYVKIVVENSSLIITGNLEKLGILSKNLENFGIQYDKNEHLHIEYFEDHFYLSPKTSSLVIRHL